MIYKDCSERVVMYYKNSGPYYWFSMRWLTEEEKEKYMKERKSGIYEAEIKETQV